RFFGKQVEGHVHGARGVTGSAEAVSGVADVPVVHAVELHVLEQLVVTREDGSDAVTDEQVVVHAHRPTGLVVFVVGDTGGARYEAVDAGAVRHVVVLHEDDLAAVVGVSQFTLCPSVLLAAGIEVRHVGSWSVDHQVGVAAGIAVVAVGGVERDDGNGAVVYAVIAACIAGVAGAGGGQLP